MITYQQLCDQQQKYNEELTNRRHKLRHLIGEYCQAISDDLGLTGKTYRSVINDESTPSPYIKLLELESGENQHIHIMELPVSFDNQNNPQALAGIAITLERSANTYPKQNLFLRTEFKLEKNQLSICFIDFEEASVINVDLNTDNKFNYAVECYKQAVMRTFSLKS
ncbi:Uncharacterised protein [uncultured Avibacterium sp.]|uniref:Uncharacterized protein n=1 Tax=uncultured Avibacterium sp. TaxID=1936169 RepID=A0A486XD57_9PAST|nr:Uncharacterised protein [uncultured Avibacterium sp.]